MIAFLVDRKGFSKIIQIDRRLMPVIRVPIGPKISVNGPQLKTDKMWIEFRFMGRKNGVAEYREDP